MIAMALWFALLGFGAYLLWRNGRGPDQPTIREDFKAVLRLPFNIVEDGKEHRSAPRRPSAKSSVRANARDRIYEATPVVEPTEDERLDEIIALQELWDLSGQETEKEEKGI